ncbi:MAG: RHS repeat-associated core domain-containing protein [Candidatus Melainabacteria bacterium]|nr:RHS repeat-associated core domain-containing protein [Candidatus Melainabacteria bacterium]
MFAITDNTGAVANRYEYSPWGESPSMSGTTHGFQGQRYDSETGLYYMKARHYDPKTRRFLQPDPIGYGDGLNLYQFAYDNPNNFTDPLGPAADGDNGWGNNHTGYDGSNGWGNNHTGYEGGNGWGNGYGFGNYHVGYDAGATIDIRLPDGTVIIVDLDAGGIVTNVTPGHPGQVNIDLSPPLIAQAGTTNEGNEVISPQGRSVKGKGEKAIEEARKMSKKDLKDGRNVGAGVQDPSDPNYPGKSQSQNRPQPVKTIPQTTDVRDNQTRTQTQNPAPAIPLPHGYSQTTTPQQSGARPNAQ